MSAEGRRRAKDILTLHVPLVIVVAFCAVATVIEYTRAQEGVGRAWVYVFQWPIIGAFAVVIWNRYRKHGNLTRWFTDRARARIAALQAQSEAESDAAGAQTRPPAPVDPDEVAWREYVADLQRRESEHHERP
jgi:hypothetical protein